MERITDSFTVATPIETTWNILLDIERIAPCLPGAQLQEIEGEEYRGIVKVKVGPITAQYKGAAKLAEVDESARRILIDASGRDTRGQGNANATITVQMAEHEGGTKVELDTELHVTGKVAQFGRGAMAEISAKLLKQFVDNLERDVLSGATTAEAPAEPADAHPDAGTVAPAPADAPAESASSPEAPSGGAAPVALDAPDTAAASGPRKIDAPEAQPVDLLDAAGAPILKRLAPLALLLLVIAVLVRGRRRRRRG